MKLLQKIVHFNIIKILFCIFTECLIFISSQTAFADECDNVTMDPAWNESLQMLADMVGNQQYAEAHKLAQTMNERCSRSPMMNFIEGKLFEKEGKADEAKFHYQKASEYTYEFAVSPEVSKRIWYARYEYEYPERTEAAIQKLVDDKLNAETELSNAHKNIIEHDSFYAKKLEDEYRLAMWTGTGIGITGVTMLATGLGLIASMSDNDKYQKRTNPTDIYMISHRYNAGWTVCGLGLAATLSGAIVAGIFGYKLTHIDNEKSIALHLSPSAASINLTF